MHVNLNGRGRWLAHLACLLVAVAAVRPLAAKTTQVIYAQRLVDHAIFLNSALIAAGIYTEKPGTGGTVLVAAASSDDTQRTFDPAAPTIDGDHPPVMPMKNARCFRVLVSLEDMSTANIGVLALDFRPIEGQAEQKYRESALEIRNQLLEIIPRQSVLFDPYTKGSDETDTLAQRINNTLAGRHPDVNVVAIHLTAPGEKLNRVWGINRPDFLGRPSDEIDTDTEQTGRIVMQVIRATHRLEVHMPMLDGQGRLVGTLCTVYFWHDEREAGDLYARSLGIRDEARLLMPANRDDLFKP